MIQAGILISQESQPPLPPQKKKKATTAFLGFEHEQTEHYMICSSGFDACPQPFTSMISSLRGPLLTPTSAQQPHSLRLRGAVSQLEGPALRPAKSSLFASTSSGDGTGGMEVTSMQTSLTPRTIRQVSWDFVVVVGFFSLSSTYVLPGAVWATYACFQAASIAENLTAGFLIHWQQDSLSTIKPPFLILLTQTNREQFQRVIFIKYEA